MSTIISTTITCYLLLICIQFIYSAPIGQNSDVRQLIQVKEGSTKDDLDQFFKDQPHLVGDKRPVNENEASSSSQLIFDTFGQLPFANNIISVVNPSTIGELIVGGPWSIWMQYLSKDTQPNPTKERNPKPKLDDVVRIALATL